MFFPFSRAESHAEEDETGESTDTMGTAPRGIRHKVVVMGAAKVGKSSLITQFLYGTFSDKYKRTVEEMHQGDFCVQASNIPQTLSLRTDWKTILLQRIGDLIWGGYGRFPITFRKRVRMKSHTCNEDFILVDSSHMNNVNSGVTSTESIDEIPYMNEDFILVDSSHMNNVNSGGVGLTLDILDTSGAFEFPAMRALSISSADAFILVYSVVDAASFEEARVIREQILETKGGVVPIVVVGNKIDLADEKREVEREREREREIVNRYSSKVSLMSKLCKTFFLSLFVAIFLSISSDAKWLYFPGRGQQELKLKAVSDTRRFNNRKVSMEMTESVVTVDWENGFVEASAKENINVTKVFKELLVQAKVKYNLSPALRRKRRQSLPPPQHGSSGGGNPAIPSAAQLAHLRSIQERHTGAGGKRNSCSIS
ncbi:hypothetical protein J6590_035979 [Homalodisca vitripennis]|nr:hypothetical protein J6590_035979 [Homalodisca vitripennis]